MIKNTTENYKLLNETDFLKYIKDNEGYFDSGERHIEVVELDSKNGCTIRLLDPLKKEYLNFLLQTCTTREKVFNFFKLQNFFSGSKIVTDAYFFNINLIRKNILNNPSSIVEIRKNNLGDVVSIVFITSTWRYSFPISSFIDLLTIDEKKKFNSIIKLKTVCALRKKYLDIESKYLKSKEIYDTAFSELTDGEKLLLELGEV